MDPRTGFIPADFVKEQGRELREGYAAADPFPSVLIDDFLPAELAEGLLTNFGPAAAQSNFHTFERAQERHKSGYPPELLNDYARTVFYAFNSLPFIKLIENITGIEGLIPDPYFLGAGFHEIRNGGHLSVHADFNHHKLMNLERRVNVLIYLNKDWKEEYGGQIELWDTKMSRQVQSHVPIFNRCIIFNTTSYSMHGNPQVVNHPDGVTRKSIALYYYTATWTGEKRSHTTQFQVRPDSEDRKDWTVKIDELKRDFIPPVAMRQAQRIKRLLRR